jgi:hypothetical protein
MQTGGTEALHVLDLDTKGEWSALWSGCFAAWERAVGTLWEEGWLSFKESLMSKISASSETGLSLTLLPNHCTD